MISAPILRKALLIALVLLIPTAIFYKFVSIHAVTVFVLSFIVSLKDVATLGPRRSVVLGGVLTVLFTPLRLLARMRRGCLYLLGSLGLSLFMPIERWAGFLVSPRPMLL